MRSINGRDLADVTLDLYDEPFALRAAEIPARTRVHRGDHSEIRRNVSDEAAREIVTSLSSIGCRRTSSTLRSNSEARREKARRDVGGDLAGLRDRSAADQTACETCDAGD